MVKGFESLIERASYKNLKYLSEAEKSLMISAMRSNGLLFGAIILGDSELPMHHHIRVPYSKMHVILNSHIENMIRPSKTAIVGPRDSAKTTYITLVQPLKRITYAQERFILMTSESETQSIFNLEALGNEVEFNPKYEFFFGKRQGDTWATLTKTFITKLGEETEYCKVLVRGVEQRVRGLKFGPYRPTLTIGDDFEGEGNTLTENERDKMRRWVNAQVIPGSASANVIFMGTILDDNSYLNRIAGSAAWHDGQYLRKGWSVFFFQSILQDTKPGEFVAQGREILDSEGVPKVLWPERRPYAWLEAERERLASEGDEAFFFQEYQNIPYSDADSTFRKKDIRYWDGFYTIEDEIVYLNIRSLDGEEVSKKIPVNVFMGSDPASSENVKADKTAHIVIFYDSENTAYVWNYFHDNVTPIDGAIALWDMMEEYGKLTPANSRQPKMVNVEKTGHAMFEQYMREKSRESGRFYNIVPQDAIKSKHFRIKQLQPRFAQKGIFIRREHVELEGELLSYRPHKKGRKDLLDSLRWSLEKVWPPNFEKDKSGEWQRPKPVGGFDWQTGMPVASLAEYQRIAGRT